MDHFQISAGDDDPGFCVLDDEPEGTGALTHRMTRGSAMGADYPGTPPWPMSKKFGGIKIPSVIESTSNLLVVHRSIAEIFGSTDVKLELLPFVLVNHKGRVASKDYRIVSVLGTFDCLSLEDCDIEWEDGEVVHAYECVLDRRKMKKAPPVFRIQEDPYRTVVAQAVADRILALKPTNLRLEKLEQAR